MSAVQLSLKPACCTCSSSPPVSACAPKCQPLGDDAYEALLQTMNGGCLPHQCPAGREWRTVQDKKEQLTLTASSLPSWLIALCTCKTSVQVASDMLTSSATILCHAVHLHTSPSNRWCSFYIEPTKQSSVQGRQERQLLSQRKQRVHLGEMVLQSADSSSHGP